MLRFNRHNKRIVTSHLLGLRAGVVYRTEAGYSYWLETRVGGMPLEVQEISAPTKEQAVQHMLRYVKTLPRVPGTV